LVEPAGWVDGYFEHGLSRWDWAAGSLIASEAGATVRLPGATGDQFGEDLLLAATPAIADALGAAMIDSGLAAI